MKSSHFIKNPTRRSVLRASAFSTLAALGGCSELLTFGSPKKLWRYRAASPVLIPPIIQDDTMFIGSDDSWIYALAEENGVEQWTIEISQGGGVKGIRIHESVILCGSEDAHVYALATDDGSEHWRTEVGGEVWCRPAVVNDTVVVNARNYVIYGLSLTDGAIRWTHAIDTPTDLSTEDRELLSGSPADPVISDGVVYVGSYDRRLYALDAATGERRWSFETDGLVYTAPIVADETVYVGSLAGSLYALDATTGELRWRRYFEEENRTAIARPPAADKERVYAGVFGGGLVALDARTGEQQWQRPETVYSGVTLADDQLLFGSDDGHVYSASTSGERNWRFEAGGWIRGAPAIRDGRIYFGSMNTYVYAIEP